MEIITNKIYICLPVEKELDKLDWNGLSTEEYNSKTYYKIPSGGYSSDVVKKITFETLKDNVTVTLNIVSSSEGGFDFAYACDLDGTSGYSNAKYKISGDNQSITCEYVVPTKGSHWIYIGYRKDASSNFYNDCGYFIIDNSDKEYAIRQPKEVYLASDKMNEITYGSKKILEYGLPSTISWETLTWDKSNNSYTYNTKGKLYINYSYDNNNYETYLLSSPASVPHPYEITKVNFHNINSYQGNSYNCTYKLDLSEFNTYKFNSMDSMFYNCSSLTNLDVSNLNTSNVTNMDSMFYNCSYLTSLDVSKWDTSKVTNMDGMFYKCSYLTSLDVSKWDTSKVTNMGLMFDSCSSLTSLDVSKWDTSKVTNMDHVFYKCSSLNSLDVSKWDTSKVTNMQYMFNGCSKPTSLDVSNFNTSNVTNMGSMFFGCSSLTSLDVSKWDTSKVTSMGFMFSICSKLTSLDVSKWDTSKVTNTQYMFMSCSKLTSLDVSKWDVSKVTSMWNMFNGCSSLTSLDVSKWDVSKVTNMNFIFNYCSSLTTLIDGHESDSYIKALNKLKVNIDLSTCVKLNYESVYAVFNGLAMVTGKTITLPKVMQGKLDATKVKIATDKGWTVAYK